VTKRFVLLLAVFIWSVPTWANIDFETDVPVGKKVCIWAIHTDDRLHSIITESYLTKARKDNPPKKAFRIKNQYRKTPWILKKPLRLSSTSERRIEQSWYSAELELLKQTNDWPKNKVIVFRFIRIRKKGWLGCKINKKKSVFFSNRPPKKKKRTFKSM